MFRGNKKKKFFVFRYSAQEMEKIQIKDNGKLSANIEIMPQTLYTILYSK